MQKLFNKIVIPVDFSNRSNVAIEKAIEIAKEYDCSIQLVHVVTISPIAAVAVAEGHMAIPYDSLDNKANLEHQMKKLVSYAKSIAADRIKIEFKIVKGTWDEVIIDQVIQHKFDLVLIGQKGRGFRKRRMILNPDKIAAKTNIPVITIPASRKLTRLYAIVIPITDFLPVRKLIYGIYMASKFDTTIKLLGIENEKTKTKVQNYLMKAFELIKENSNLKVEFETTENDNVAIAVNQFAKLHSADLVILNPGTQTKMPGFFSNFLGKIIQKYSYPPVLTINPV